MQPVSLNILKDNKHSYVGLDLSLHSSGMSYVAGDTVYAETYDSTKGLDKDDPLYDGKIRERLRSVLLDFVNRYSPEYVVIEDVFNGHTPKIYRQLMNINSIIDELILKGEVNATLVRVDNRRWKSWLSSLIPREDIKFMKDKIKIETCLAEYGLTRNDVDHKGYQDELDSIGMAIGYYLHTFYNKSDEEVELQKITGDSLTKKQLLSVLAFDQSKPLSCTSIKTIDKNGKLNKSISRGLLYFLRYVYDTLNESGSSCIKFNKVNLGNICAHLSLVPTFPPSDLYVSYKK